MSKTLKRTLFIVLSVFLVLTLLTSICFNAERKTYAEVGGDSYFVLDDGAEICIAPNKVGIRFTTRVSESYYNALNPNENIVVFHTEINKADNPVSGQEVIFDFGVPEFIEGEAAFYASIVYSNLTDAQLKKATSLNLKAVSYVTVNGEKTYANASDNIRSMRTVANNAILNGGITVSEFPDLNKYITEGNRNSTVTGTVNNVNGEGSVTIPELPIGTYTKAFVGAKEYNITNDGNVITILDLAEEVGEYFITIYDEDGAAYSTKFEVITEKGTATLDAILCDKLDGDGTNFAISVPEELDVADIEKFFDGETEVAIVSKNTTANTITVAKANVVSGINKTLKFETADTIYSSTATVATRIISNKAELVAFAKAYDENTQNDLYLLDADIDFGNENITEMTDSKIINATYSLNGTIDGQGHIISNIACTNGVFPRIAATGVLKNIGFINVQKAVNVGGGLISNSCRGTIENCYAQGTISDTDTTVSNENKAGIANSIKEGGKIINCLADITYTHANANVLCYGLTGSDTDANSTLQNSCALSTTVNALTKVTSNTNTNNALYNSIETMLAGHGSKLNGNGPWKYENGALKFGSNTLYTFVDKTAVSFKGTIANDKYTVDLTNIDAGYTSTGVTGILINNTPVEFTKNGNNVSISQSNVATLGGANFYFTILFGNTAVKVRDIAFEVELANASDLQFYLKNMNYLANKNTVITLTADIDASTVNDNAATDNSSNVNTEFTFNGNGHTISNFTSIWGLFGSESNAKISNVGLVNCSVIGRDSWGGLITRYTHSDFVFENSFIKGTTFNTAGTGIVLQMGKSATDVGGTFRNVVVIGEKGNGSVNLLTASANCYGGTLENVFGVSGTITKSCENDNAPNRTETNFAIYKNILGLSAQCSTLNGNGVWKYENNALMFGSKVIYQSIDKTIVNNDIDLHNEKVEFKFADLDAALQATDIKTILVNGTEVNFEVNEGKIKIISSSVPTSQKGEGNAVVITNEGKVYKTSVYVADLIISDLTSLNEYGINCSKYLGVGKLVALGANVDGTGANAAFTTIDTGTAWNCTSSHTFDGRGYSISNLTVEWGFMGFYMAGTLKNTAFINCTIAGARNGWGGFITGTTTAKSVIENCYFKNTNIGSAYRGIVKQIGSSAAAAGGTIKNIIVEGERNGATVDLLTSGSYCYGGTIENVFGITASFTKYVEAYNGLNGNEIGGAFYANTVALYADTTENGALSVLNGNGAWKVIEGNLYFGNILID